MMKRFFASLLLLTLLNKTVLASHTSGTLAETTAQCYPQSPIDRHVLKTNKILFLKEQQAASRNPAEVESIQRKVRQLQRLTARLEHYTIEHIAAEFVAAQAPATFARKKESPIPKDHPGLKDVDKVLRDCRGSRMELCRHPACATNHSWPRSSHHHLPPSPLQALPPGTKPCSEEFPEISEAAYFEDFGSQESQISTVKKVIELLKARQETLDGNSPEYDRHDNAIVRLEIMLEILEGEQEK